MFTLQHYQIHNTKQEIDKKTEMMHYIVSCGKCRCAIIRTHITQYTRYVNFDE